MGPGRAMALVPAAVAAAGLLTACGGSSGGSASTAPPAATHPGTLRVHTRDMDDVFRAQAQIAGRSVPASGVIVDRVEGGSPLIAARLTDDSRTGDEVRESAVIETVDGRPATAAVLNAPLAGRPIGARVTIGWSAPDGSRHTSVVPLVAQAGGYPADRETDTTGGYFPGG